MTTRHIESMNGFGRFIYDPDKAKAALARKLVYAAQEWRMAFDEVPLPSKSLYSEYSQHEDVLRVDLHQQTYELLRQLRDPSDSEKEALGKMGIKFFPIASKSYAEVVAEDLVYFRHKQLEYASARPELRNYALPTAVQVGLRPSPSELALPGSFDKSRGVHLEMIEDYSKELQAQFPDARAIMLPSTGYAQADRACKAKTGEVLFTDYSTSTLDNTSRVHAAYAGRAFPSGQFEVVDWSVYGGHGMFGAVPAVVFIGNK